MLVLLDRDGVINEDTPLGVARLEEFRLLPGALEGIARLSQAGWRIAVVTNQSAVAKGLLSLEALEALHAHLRRQVSAQGGRIDAFYVCTDHPDHPTPRRKPAPGMILEALRDFGADAAATPFIGDALRDMQAAARAGCPRILVKTGKGKIALNTGLPDEVQPVTTVDGLSDAAAYVIAHFGQGVPV